MTEEVVVEFNSDSEITTYVQTYDLVSEIEVSDVDIVEVAVQGPAGRDGRDGAAGRDGVGGDQNYIHNQLASSTVWTIVHNLGKKPSVTVIDSGDNVVIGDVEYIDLNTVQITFTAEFGGQAILN